MAKPGLHLVVNCERCGIEYRQSRSDQRFCGKICAVRTWRENLNKDRKSTCKECGKIFNPFFTRKTKYCSTDCNINAGKNKKKLKNTGEGKGHTKGKEFVPRRFCVLCGSRFYAPPSLIKRGGGKFCSNNCRTTSLGNNPEMWPKTKNKRSKIGKRQDLDNKFFRSSWEANYARYLNLLKSDGIIIKWEYETDTFYFEGIKRGSRFYTPDFKIFLSEERYEYHEIKGYMDTRSKTKLKRMSKYFPNETVILIDKIKYKELEKQFKFKIPFWE